MSCLFRSRFVLSFSLAVLVLIISIPAHSSAVQLTPDADSFMRKGYDNLNEGANKWLFVMQQGPKRAIFTFDLSGLDPAAQVLSAQLILTVSDDAVKWQDGRAVDLHRLLVPFTEGNGRKFKESNSIKTRGTGPGVTWSCAEDTAIENTATDCVFDWDGGWLNANQTATYTIVHTNDMAPGDTLAWDVTADVQAAVVEGAGFVGWIVRKREEGKVGKIVYWSKDGALEAGDMTLAPTLAITLSDIPEEDIDGDGYTVSQGDCDDNDALVNPGAVEVCDAVDNNCDGTVDEGVTITFYADADGDGYGLSTDTLQSCSTPPGYAGQAGDCDDTAALVNPGAAEVCNAVDDNCDGTVDEGFDLDADGYTVCAGDCDDAAAAVNPAASETCNEIDDNCDGQVDEGVQLTFYQDADGDGFGVTTDTVQACTAPSGYTNLSGDCDDASGVINPGAAEICNAVDDNCDGTIDEGFDLDADGYTVCAGDCDDAAAAVNPAASETCNEIDDNCDGIVDEGVTLTFYADADADGYGVSTDTVQACTAPSGYVSVIGDCNEADPEVNPAAIEVCDGVDNNCDGITDPVCLTGIIADPVTFYLSGAGVVQQLLVTGYYSDGSSADLTSSSTGTFYTSSDPSVVTASVDGLVTSVGLGSTTITAVNSDQSSNVTVTVWSLPANYQPQPEGSFGSIYEDLVPPDITLDSFDPQRFSLITGLIQMRGGLPLADVTVTIHGHPEYGSVVSDSLGRFTIPVDGETTMTVAYTKTGLLEVHRKVFVPWNDMAVVETITMIPEDIVSTQVAFDGNPATVYTHRSTETVDASGQRALTAVITGDNRAYYIDSVGTQVFLPIISVRATEYDTPETMPAKLPPTSAFTYCAELSVDGVSDIQFEQPVVTFVENFLGFDVGTPVPIGYYNRSLGEWVPEVDGIVVRLLDTDSDGVVDALDADGDGIQDDLNSNGLFSDEVAGLQDSTIYQPQSTYWMVKLTHFTPWDWNWPFGLPGDAFPPSFDAEPSVDARNDGPLGCGNSASLVEHRSRVFHEDIPVPGTGLTLHYSSGRVEGYKSIITVPASGATVPASLKRVEVELNVAGRLFKQVLNAAPNQKAEFAWDGKDFNGRSMFGRVPATIRIDFIYDGVYRVAGGFERTFAQLGGAPTAIPTREIVSSSRTQQVTIRRNELSPIADGWTLSNNHYHYLDLNGQSVVFKGDGTRQLSAGNIFTIDTIAGNGNTITAGAGIEEHPDGTATDIAISPKPAGGITTNERILADGEGNIYFIESYSDPNSYAGIAGLVRKIDKSGVLSTIAGGGNNRQNGIQATDFLLYSVSDIDMDNEGNLYIAEWYGGWIQKVSTDGIINTAVGKGYCAWGVCRDGDEGFATEAHIAQPSSITIDTFGNLYLVDDLASSFPSLRKVDANGIITTLAFPFNGVDLMSDQFGNIYYYDTPGGYWTFGIYRREPNNRTTFVAGGGTQGSGQDGAAAVGAYIEPTALTVDSFGNIYFVDGRARIRKVDQSGVLSTVAGTLNQGYGGDTGPATEATMTPDGITLDVAGNIYASGNNRIRKIFLTNTTGMDAYLAEGEAGFAEEGNIGYVFSPLGYHRRTIDLGTGQTLTTFGNDTQDQLVSITDRFGNETNIQRDAGGVPVSITSPDGIVTLFSVDTDNNLRQVTYPDGAYYAMDYLPGGLMSGENHPDGSLFTHVFDPYGRLTDALDPEGGHWTYDRQADASGNVNVSVLTGEGDSTTYVDRTKSTGEFSSVITGPDGSQTTFIQSADGLSAQKQTACGTDLTFNYGLDSEFSYQKLQSTTTTMSSGLSVATSTDRVYSDTDLDGNPDLITDTITTNGKVSTVVNDTLTGTVTATSPTGRIVTPYYDPVSLLTSRTSTPGLLDMDFIYDPRGRLTDVTVGTRTTSFAYDANGYLDFMTTPDNRTFDYTYDVMGRLTGEVRPDGAGVSYSYDNNGNMTVLVNSNLVSHSFSYTANDQRKAYNTPISGGYSYFYDKDRRLASVTYPSGQSISNFYLGGNLDITTTPEGNISYSYDCGGKLGSVTKGTESTSYTYDGPLLLTDTRLGTVNEVIDYTYDSDMRVGSIGYASGVEFFLYDNDGLLTTAGSFTITRNASNGLPEAVSDGTVVQGRVFSGYGEVDSVDYSVGAATPYSWSVTRDLAGRITQKVENIGLDNVTWDYTYDLMGRLETVYKDNALAEAYSYDDNGNRTSENNVLRSVSRSYSNSVEDHVLTAGADSYVFDVDGFLTSRTIASGANSGITTFDYSSRGELLSVTLPNTDVITYDHDPLGRRIAKRLNGVITEKYLWQDSTTLLAVYDGSDTLIQRFSYADGRMPVSMTYQGAVYYLTYDQVGSLRAVTDTTGAIVKRIDYDSFGNVLSDSNPTFSVPFGFAGGLHDRNTGLVRFGARDYDPVIGRWTAKDPIDFAGGDLNLFGYVLGDPVNGVDPWGLFNIIINDTGGRDDATYGGTITVTGNNGQTVIVSGSSWPNPTNPSPGVSAGTYNSTYSGTGHQGTSPSVRINNGGQVPTLGLNPAQNNQSFATGINIHCGFSPTNRGSAGCVTIQPSQCQEVWDVLQEGETGTVTINR